MNLIKAAIITLCALHSETSLGMERTSHFDLNAINFDLLSPYSQEDQKYPTPSVAIFKHEDRELRYMGVGHVYGTTSPEHQKIKESIEEFRPNLVILEGFDGRQETTDRHKQRILTLNLADCGENDYAAYLAQEMGIEFVGGEPTHIDAIEAVMKQGYSHHDIAYFYFTRCIPQFYSERVVQSFADLPSSFEGFFKRIPAFDQEYSFNDYQSWLNSCNPGMSFEDLINSGTTFPLSQGHKIQQISCAITRERDKAIIKQTLGSLNIHKRVLIIYGSGHYFAQAKLLESYLGKPVIS